MFWQQKSRASFCADIMWQNLPRAYIFLSMLYVNTYFTNVSRVCMVENLWCNNAGDNVISRMLQFAQPRRNLVELLHVTIIVPCCNNGRQEFETVDTTAKLWQSIPHELLCVTIIATASLKLPIVRRIQCPSHKAALLNGVDVSV